MGIQSDYDGLNVIPCIPDDRKEFTVTRKFRGTEYVIHVKRTGEKSVTADGVLLSDTCLPLYPGKEKVAAEVTL